MRNTQVHRARRLGIKIHDEKHPRVFQHPLPQAPACTDAEALARVPRSYADSLHEHAQITLEGILATITAVTTATAAAATRTWNTWRGAPALVPQPTAQWPKLPQGRITTFPGYQPTQPKPFGAHDVMLIHPSLSRRLQAGRFTGSQRHQWVDWMTSD